MGLFGSLFHKSIKKKIKRNTAWYKSQTPDQRGGLLFYIWITRGINLGEFCGNPESFLPIYFYAKGAESPITELIEGFKNANNTPMSNAAHHHFYTNLSVSYPAEGYGPLVREMWRAVLEDSTDMGEVVAALEPVLDNEGVRSVLNNNDVSIDEFVSDPQSIMPHFLVPGHPLSAQLVEREKLSAELLGR